MNQLSGATGILINGCTSGFSSGRLRRRRSVAPFIETRSSSCSSSESSDSSLSADVFDSICNTDASVDSTLASAATQAVTSLNTLKSVDSSTFSHAGLTRFDTITAIFGFVLVTILNLLNSH